MTYAVSASLQTALYEALRTDPALVALIGDAVFDVIPAGPRPDLYVAIGPEQVRDRSDMTGDGALHDVVVRVVAEQSGFAQAKQVAATVCDALHQSTPDLTRGKLVFLHFTKGRAVAARQGTARQIDLTFQARVCDSAAS